MQTKTVEKVVKHSLLYSLAITQPFLTYPTFATPLHDESLFHQRDLRFGDHGELVRHIQLKLQKTGYYEDEIDGIYGLYTEQAVRSFQSTETISISGIIDETTFERLVISEKKEALHQIENELQAITFGDVNDDVTKVQEVLFFYGYYKGEIDGIYGTLTEDAIKQVEQEKLITISTNKELPTKSTRASISEVSNDNPADLPITDENERKAKNEVEERNNTSSDIKKVTEQTEDKTTNQNKKEESTDEVVAAVTIKNQSDTIINKAKSFLGTPYVWGGTSPSGFDCSGFIQYVYKESDIVIPRTVSEIWNFTNMVSSPSIGDFVFFETYQPGPSHMGIYLGDGNFIHAGSTNGVEISNLNDNNYWSSRYLGAKRINE